MDDTKLQLGDWVKTTGYPKRIGIIRKIEGVDDSNKVVGPLRYQIEYTSYRRTTGDDEKKWITQKEFEIYEKSALTFMCHSRGPARTLKPYSSVVPQN